MGAGAGGAGATRLLGAGVGFLAAGTALVRAAMTSETLSVERGRPWRGGSDEVGAAMRAGAFLEAGIVGANGAGFGRYATGSLASRVTPLSALERSSESPA